MDDHLRRTLSVLILGLAVTASTGALPSAASTSTRTTASAGILGSGRALHAGATSWRAVRGAHPGLETRYPVRAGSRVMLAHAAVSYPVRGADRALQRGAHVGITPPAADSSRARVFRWMYRDVGALAKRAVTPKVALYSAAAVGGTFAMAWYDDDLYERARSIYKGAFREGLEVVDYLGGPMINAPVVLVAGISLLTNNVKFQDAAFTSLQNLIYAGILGYTLKAIFGRDRPEWSDDPYDFFVRSARISFLPEGNSSFPSGHAIASFGIITPWVLYYPSVFTYALYILPVGTGISRVALGKHWATDIVVGAVIGVTMGRWLTRRHRNFQRQQNASLSLSFMQEGRLFRLRLNIP